MNVLLVNPQSSSVFNTFGLSLPPIGLLYVAASLEQAGHKVVVRDLAADDERLDDGDIRRADLVGISADTTRAGKALSIARRVAAIGRPVVMGGPHPQFMAADIFAAGCVDYIVKGEGELVFPNLLTALQNRDSVASVKGLIIKDGRHLIETPAADPIDVETLPFPARHLVDLHRYRASMSDRPITPIVTSRGCPSACHFCSSSSFFGRGWRYRSAASVLAELDEIYNRYGFRAVCFMDDNFTLAPQRVEQIADGIIDRGYDLRWWNFSRVDTIVKNSAMVARMAAAGSETIYLGIESSSEETLNSLGKNSKASDVTLAVDILRQNGIESYGSYIIGNLNETAADVEKTIDLAVRLNTNIAQFTILTPYPGTKLYEQVKDRIFCRRWKFYDGLHLVFRHPLINRHYLQFLLIKAFVKFYRRSEEATQGFRQAAGRGKLSFRKLAVCAWELFF
ncbi:MAG: cobalamin B12-binding domain-containing protein [Verrucomicrobia bacterium]|nr:cobalamin B12-binding domain-containing protein [Deltaproteobacteria bacterium]